MSWQLFQGCAQCGVEAFRACRTPDNLVALLPCPGRRMCASADPTIVRRWKARRRRRAVLDGLLPESGGAVAVVDAMVSANEARGKRSTYHQDGVKLVEQDTE
jgi:hypothetical protein